MTFMENIKKNIKDNNLPVEFNTDDLKGCNDITDKDIQNIANYDVKNSKSTNKNKKVLVSKTIHNKLYYSFEKRS